MGQEWLDAERARSRRPITPNEVPRLEEMAAELQWLRVKICNLSRSSLAWQAKISVRQIEQIERAIRRTRRSTLERLVAVFVKVRPEIGDLESIVDWLADLAGPSLAEESEYRVRVEKRRKARWAKKHRRFVYRVLIPILEAEMEAERLAGE